MSKLIKDVVQKVTASYRRLCIVRNADGFFAQEAVCSRLHQEGIEVVAGTNLKLRVHYETKVRDRQDGRFIYVCDRPEMLLADMTRDTVIQDFSISDLFPLMADKTLVRKQPYEVLEQLYERLPNKRMTMPECKSAIASVVDEIKEKTRRSASNYIAQLSHVNLDWGNQLETMSSVSRIIVDAIRSGVYERVQPAVEDINRSFQVWIDQEYFATLQSNHLNSPKSVNKMLPHIADKHDKSEKVALLVVDGFAYWQYSVLGDYLHKQGFVTNDGCALSWLPSITMLSRQAIFRGSNPKQDYKQDPDNEKKLWNAFWQQKGFGGYELQYISDKDEFAINEGVKRLAVVTVEMDEKMHSSTDYKDLLSLTENWCPRVTRKIKAILNAGFKLYLTTDHGSALSTGWRTLTTVEKIFLYKDGSRGSRHLIYKDNNKEEENKFYEDSKKEISLLKHGNWLVIRNSQCFAKENTITITHGGSHFMEVVIPFIQIR